MNIQKSPFSFRTQHVLELGLLTQEMKFSCKILLSQRKQNKICIQTLDQCGLLRVGPEPLKDLVFALTRLIGC
jgi:hypothetical protein